MIHMDEGGGALNRTAGERVTVEGAESCMQRYTTVATAPQGSTAAKAKRRQRGKLAKGDARKVNNFRLHDIVALIDGRHVGWCDDPEWLRRYFYTALPHLIVSRVRWLDAVRNWVGDHLPLLIVQKGLEWVEDEARACHAKPFKCPTTDALSKLLMVQPGEWVEHGMCTIPAASRPRKVRDADDRERRRKAEFDRRAEDPNHTPRGESKEAHAKAQGTTASALRAKAWREARKAEEASKLSQVAPAADQTERVSCPSQSLSDGSHNRQTERVSCPTISVGMRTGFVPHNTTRPRHYSPIPGNGGTNPANTSNESHAAA
ncbi:hypothetical protein [Methylobacterium brachiatum]|uniref:hypothetical protein n=1 Tax=Methylobacterium brachiatum TaxID=269660 RepID=UPI0013CE76B9|nr:hypothetical protein [Methylobacterium brachiatum]